KHTPALESVLAKTACGAVDHIPVAYATNLSRALEELQKAGFTALAMDEHGEKQIGEFKLNSKIVVVLGSEGSGIRPLIKNKCDVLIRLPTSGAIASLNVSNAAAVAFYALTTNIIP
ncbi:MAG: RNA methyltransferase, partial [Alphaproteobacteria bacterium]|nr:RNA methyltransferase [Alphaproteobacteria bacterium]